VKRELAVPIAESTTTLADVDTRIGIDVFRLATTAVTEVQETVASISPLRIAEVVLS
jgi:hypothetical protein